MLTLERPIVVFDIESTGLDKEKDRIVEISAVKINGPDAAMWEVRTKRVNPGIPIPEQASDVHGITDEMVKDCPPFRSFAKAFMSLIDGCDLGGFNCLNYDVPLLYFEFERAGIEWDYSKHAIVDSGNLFKIKEPRDLTAAVKFYLNEEMENAHGAEADAVATAKVLVAQLTKYTDLQGFLTSELAQLTNFDKKILDISGRFTYNDQDEIVFNFGENKGKPVKDNIGMLQWMINKKFPSDSVKLCRKFIQQYNK